MKTEHIIFKVDLRVIRNIKHRKNGWTKLENERDLKKCEELGICKRIMTVRNTEERVLAFKAINILNERKYEYTYIIKQTEEDEEETKQIEEYIKEMKVDVLYNYDCSPLKAMADCKAKNITRFKHFNEIYEVNALGKWVRKAIIVDVESYAVSGDVFSFGLI